MEMHLKKENPQLLITVTQGSEVVGYLGIDSLVAGSSCGGLRMLPVIDEKEIGGLAQTMTLKYGFLGLPQGGAKAGVLGDPEAPKTQRREKLVAFGRAIAPLLRNRIYIPVIDMGTEKSDIVFMLQKVGVRLNRRRLPGQQSGYFTALTVFSSAMQAMGHLNRNLSGCRVAIEGFGKVGNALAKLMIEANARIVAVSTSKGAIYNPKGLDIERLTHLATGVGSAAVELYEDSQRIPHDTLLELPVDLLCPCAHHNRIHSGNANRIAAKVICAGANNPVTLNAEKLLHQRGILCLPDFVTNSGGVLGGTMEFASVNNARIRTFIDHHFGHRIAWLLKEAARQKVPPRAIAAPLALQRVDRVQRNAAHPSRMARFFSLSLELYRHGYIPGPLVASLAPLYFKRLLA
jgi:glutamate dehydrogenase (NAD(P)+)